MKMDKRLDSFAARTVVTSLAGNFASDSYGREERGGLEDERKNCSSDARVIAYHTHN